MMRKTIAGVRNTGLLLAALAAFGASQALAADAPAGGSAQTLPAAWLQTWNDPPLADRPLQIVHAIDLGAAMAEGVDQMVPGTGARQSPQRATSFFTQRGLGGIVCNVAFQGYLQSEENWKRLVAGVEACSASGMVVWLYDEEGYPSGAAGGLVLKENPSLEALALAHDASRPEPFFLRPAYEHTHASNNYYAARRYVNLIDDRATRSFIDHTHEAYYQRLKPHFGKTIQAMFTDEPSLIAVNLGQIPEDARKRARVVDPIDPAVKPLPSVPWGYDLPRQYRARYGEDLAAQRKSLFAGDSPADRKIRAQFWGLIAELVAKRYFGAIQDWCAQHGVASSGHCLHEESVIHHPALVGNTLEALTRMHIPGLDMLTSDPEAVIHSGWLTAALPASAAILNGGRRVMTEVSDFGQVMSQRGPVGVAEMQATAAWQAAWGVTEFTLYYGMHQRSADDYRAYGTYVGRLNAILKPSRMVREVLLYYPVRDLWEEYLPVAGPFDVRSQSGRAQQVVGSFMRIGQTLQRSQIPMALIDHEHLAAAKPAAAGALQIGDHRFTTLILPADVQLPAAAAAVVGDFEKRGGRVLRDGGPGGTLTQQAILTAIRPAWQFSPPSERITLGAFVRDGRQVLLVVNAGREPYEGKMAAAGIWQALDPATGSIRPADKAGEGHLRISLGGRQSVLLVQSP